jgi:hypothetical protein
VLPYGRSCDQKETIVIASLLEELRSQWEEGGLSVFLVGGAVIRRDRVASMR